MPYSGAVYTAPASSWNPAVSGTPISSSDWAALLADFTGAFNNIPPYATVQAGAMNFGGIAGGTANALTLSLTPALTAYNNGLEIMFFSGAAANTTAATISVNGLAATAVQLAGSALTGGEIAANRVYVVRYYNSIFHLFQPSAQAPFVLTSTAAGVLMTLTSTDAGAGQGPTLDFYRDSATPAAFDLIGGFLFNGESSTGVKREYAQVSSQIVSPTNAAESGRLRFVTVQAGTSAERFIIESGMYGSTTTGADKGLETVNAKGLYVNGHGTVAQFVQDVELTYTTCSTSLPVDNTIPQITEGDEVLSIAITPVNASSTLIINATLNVGASTTMNVGAALFVVGTANALAATSQRVEGATAMYSMKLRFAVSAASTSARTYTVRLGPTAAGNAFLNGDGGARQFGGVAVSSIEVREMLPQ